MAANSEQTVRISRSVPLEQIREPETDIREHRPAEQIQSLAASMGDPDVGQLQDVLVHPVDYDELEDVDSRDDLHELFADGHPMRIVDGETRRLAAQRLGWATLDATIVPEPPESTIVAQLDANTERIEMNSYETVRALYQHYDETDATLEDMQDMTGLSVSHLSNMFSTLESPDWLTDPWRHPEHPLESSHAKAVKSFLTSQTIEDYAHAGDMDEEEARQRAVKDAKLMIDVQGKHDLAVGEFRKRCKRCKAETLEQLRDGRSHQEKTDDGTTQRSEQRATTGQPAETPDRTCDICGNKAERRIAIDVCREDYGSVSDLQAQGETLVGNGDGGGGLELGDGSGGADRAAVADALAQLCGISPNEADALINEVRGQVQQSQTGGADD